MFLKTVMIKRQEKWQEKWQYKLGDNIRAYANNNKGIELNSMIDFMKDGFAWFCANPYQPK